MSKPTYTDEDVQRLVATVETVIRLPENGFRIDANALDTLEHALAPFRPDPDEAVIEAMADAIYESHREDNPGQYPWLDLIHYVPSTADRIRGHARAALAAYRAHEGSGR